MPGLDTGIITGTMSPAMIRDRMHGAAGSFDNGSV
jgi:hypothetical protein